MKKNMKKYDAQVRVNNSVEKAIKDFNEMESFKFDSPAKRLNKCKAWVYTLDKWYVLQSYNTIVCIINRETDTCYDFLRLVYGYTATSAKHISKFVHKYGKGKWGCEGGRFTWHHV